MLSVLNCIKLCKNFVSRQEQQCDNI